MQIIYKWDAEDYQNNSYNQQRWAQELIAKIDFQGNERVLDIGCGDGKTTLEVAAYVPNSFVLGVDISEEMIKFAQTKFPISDFPNLRFQNINATKLNFDNEFDIVLSFSCLHWITDHISVLEGIERSLRPFGRAFLQFLGKRDSISPIRIAAKKVILNSHLSQHFEGSERFVSRRGFYNADEYKDMLKSVNLKANRVDLAEKDMIFPQKEELKGWIRTIGSPDFLTRIPENLRQAVVNEIADTYLEDYPSDSMGLIHVPMTILEVEATKTH